MALGPNDTALFASALTALDSRLLPLLADRRLQSFLVASSIDVMFTIKPGTKSV